MKAEKIKYFNPENKHDQLVANIDNCSLNLQFYSNRHYFPPPSHPTPMKN